MFTTAPENLGDLSLDELKALARTMRAEYREALADASAETVAAVKAHKGENLDRVLAEVSRRELSDELGDDDDDDGDDDEDADDEASTEADDTTEESTEASDRRIVSTQVGAGGSTEHSSDDGSFQPSQIIASDGLSSFRAGEPFADWNEFAAAMYEKARDVRPNTTEKFRVGRMVANFNPALRLSDDPFENLKIWDAIQNPKAPGTPAELTAALCAPATPLYGLACDSVTRRPVKASLPNLAAPRAKVSVYPSPALSDIVNTAYGIWTEEDDLDRDENGIPTASKGPCATIDCADPEEFAVYGVWSCITIQNLLTLSYPELIAAYLNRLAALHARTGEIQLLTAMANSAPVINARTLGYGAATSISTQIMEYLALYRELQRFDDQPFEMWAHRWLQTAIRIDLSRRNRDGSWVIASEADANRIFTDAGVTPHWFIDNPSWSEPLPAGPAAQDDTLAPLPSAADILIAPQGKFALMDRGELSFGVTGNNLYRDNASNMKNNATMFFENFEGVVDTNTCQANILHFDELCYSGFQPADVLVNCAGELADPTLVPTS